MISLIQLKRLSVLTLLAICATSITSCENDDSSKLYFDLNQGVAIANEGSFGTGNASLSLYLPDKNKVINDIFPKVNNRPLGDVFQSIGFAGDNAYLVINASNKIEVVDKDSCTEVSTITGLEGPRYFTSISNQKAYITQWGGGGKVGVIDLTTNTLTKNITVGSGPEKLVYINGKVFVANSGGWDTDNRLSVINAQTDEVTSTITVGDNPKDFVVDKNNMLWVLCSGNVVYGANYSITSQTSSKLIMINPNTNLIGKTIDLGEAFHPSHLEINPSKDILYYGGDFGIAGIFSVSITASEKAVSPLVNEFFYGFNIDPVNGFIYGLQAPTFTSSGTMKRYSLAGEFLGAYVLGVGPNGAYFAD